MDQVKTLRLLLSCVWIAVWKGMDSAVIDVCRPQTAGSRFAGKSRRTDRCSIDSRTARRNQLPHLSSPTV